MRCPRFLGPLLALVLIPAAAAAERARLEIRGAHHLDAAGLTAMSFASGGDPVYVEPRVIVTEADVTNARVRPDPATSFPVVEFTLSVPAGKRFGEETKRLVGGQMAIIIDNRLVAAPGIVEPILGGQVTISGNFTFDEALAIANSLAPPSSQTPPE